MLIVLFFTAVVLLFWWIIIKTVGLDRCNCSTISKKNGTLLEVLYLSPSRNYSPFGRSRKLFIKTKQIKNKTKQNKKTFWWCIPSINSWCRWVGFISVREGSGISSLWVGRSRQNRGGWTICICSVLTFLGCYECIFYTRYGNLNYIIAMNKKAQLL